MPEESEAIEPLPRAGKAVVMACDSLALWASCPNWRIALTPHLIDQRLELVNVLKTAVYAGKADIRNLVELFQLLHDKLAQAAGVDLTQAKIQQRFFNAFNRCIDLRGADGAFAQRQRHRSEDLAALVIGPAAVFLDDRRKADIGTLIRGEAFFARAALAAAAYEVGVFGDPGLDDLGFKVAAKRTFHPCPRLIP